MYEIIEKTNKLSDLTEGITNFFGRPEYDTARETMLGDMCHFLDNTMQETVVIMTSKACYVSFIYCELFQNVD